MHQKARQGVGGNGEEGEVKVVSEMPRQTRRGYGTLGTSEVKMSKMGSRLERELPELNQLDRQIHQRNRSASTLELS